ncbi:MAG: hypothetical protein ACJ77V_01165 [Chloroflexota bacterium]|jgi:hypothetical protein
MRRFLALLALPVLLAVNAVPVAAIDRFHDTFTEQDDFWTDTCGFTVIRESSISGHQMEFDDGRITFTFVETTRFTSPYGAVIYRESHTAHRQPATVVSLVDGVRTDTVVYSITGLAFAVIDPGTGRVLSDRGSLTLRGTYTVNDATGEFLSFSFEILAASGPHPGLDTPRDAYDSLFCAALAS